MRSAEGKKWDARRGGNAEKHGPAEPEPIRRLRRFQNWILICVICEICGSVVWPSLKEGEGLPEFAAKKNSEWYDCYADQPRLRL